VEVVSHHADNATEVLVAGGDLYYNATAEALIDRVATSTISTSPQVSLFATGQTANHLVTDGLHLIWVQSVEPASIAFALLGAKAEVRYAYEAAAAHTIDALATDGTNVYFCESDGSGVAIRSVALASPPSGAHTLATISATDSRGIAVDGNNVIYTEYDADRIVSTLGTPSPITGQSKPTRIVVQPDAVYWIDSSNPSGTVMKLIR
jgi:hypothetical protein